MGVVKGRDCCLNKLEETRANLEERLGLDNLLQAYTVVKVHMHMYLSLSLSLSLSCLFLPPFSEYQLHVLFFPIHLYM